ncbi:MAG: FtsW/RodA/SpoVE family cell cycle protein [Saprospirales bacterium]|nr:FtsW/RodA/SpoVE family cell cycle protein [Saprospirales bacterium]MBK7335919.1 FtsW/RodA/SpoVE family cell cycle protein [Saprospirales bacterium]
MSNIGKRIYAELKGDRVIWMILAILALFSILTVYSATGSLAYQQRAGNTEAFLIRHGFILMLGLFIAYLAYSVNYMRYKFAAPWLMTIAIPLLAYTLFFGQEINDARRWIEVPFIGITFQTSDFARVALILFVAREITRHNDYIKDFNKAFLPIIVPILMVCALIAPANLSTALLLFLTCVLMMFIGRVAVRYIVLLLILGVITFAALVGIGRVFPDLVRVETWSSRLRDFATNPEGGYQVMHSKIAIASGEWIGLGPGNSDMRNYLPAPYSDFIYAIICEEYGLIGGFLILGLFVLLMFRTTALVTKSSKQFGALLALGLSLSMVIQALANMAVSVNLVPVTGLTLPVVSMGGTSVLFSCLAFGMILSVSRYVEQVTSQEADAE